MVEEPTLTEHINQSLRYNHAMLDELIEVTAEWDEIPEGELVSWTMDWHQFAMMKVPRIAERYASGAMNDEQKARYWELLQRIEQHRDLIQRFGLTMPQIPVET